SYGAHVALTDVDLQLAGGTITAVVGDNGAGKSTLLGCLAGVSRHTGQVMIDGRPLARVPPGAVAYLPQRVRPPAETTVGELLGLFRSLARSAEPDVIAPPQGFLAEFERPLAHLSGGQVRRVFLVAALMGRPDLILLDEPFANLDDEGRAIVLHMMNAHRAAGAVVVVASPIAVELLAAADQVVRLVSGRVSEISGAREWLGRLPVAIWVAPDATGVLPGDLAQLPGVTGSEEEAGWLVLQCSEADAIGLLRRLDERGIPADRLRLAAPEASSSRTSSPARALS
ncbi:MAG: ATP-binding cassette domain-containing protein, partial [Chloroflexi bacterium]|nr:ATP-binding cassette domain-containing protein [Chloroflexota bacterium]